MGLGCVLGTCFSGWVCVAFCPCFCCVEVWVVFSRRTPCFPVSGGGLASGTSDQCVSLSFIDAGAVQLPA